MSGKQHKQQRGVAIIEMVIVMPLLILLVAFVLDGSRIIQEHAVLSSLAKEIARNAASLPALEVGAYDSSVVTPGAASQTRLLYDRAATLFLFTNIHKAISSGHYELATENDDEQVVVTLRTTYKFMLPMVTPWWNWGTSDIEVRAVAPRLY